MTVHCLHLTNARLNNIPIRNDDRILRGLDPSNSSGPYGISARMLLGVYPDMWKMANLTPIHKKDKKHTFHL